MAIVFLVGSLFAANEQTVDPDKIDLESLFNVKVVTASRFPEKIADAPAVMSVVTRDELRRFGAFTVGEALERVPGLMAATGYFGDRNMVTIRGDSSKENGSHILVLINGRPAREVQEGGVISDLLQSFPVNALERIEVIRGPGSVLYGTNAFSGVINLITRRDGSTGFAARGYGVKQGAGGGSAEVSFTKGKLNVLAAGQTRFDPPRDTLAREREFGTLTSQPTVRRVSLPDRGTGAVLNVNYGNLRFTGAYTNAAAASFAFTVDETRQQRGFTNLGYSFKPMSNWETSFDLTHTLTRLGTRGSPFISRAASDTVAEWTNIVTISGRDKVTAGALLDYIEGTELFVLARPPQPVSQGSRRAAGLYAQWEHRLTEEWKLIAGIQSNKIGHLALNTVPRGGLIWSPSKKFNVKALYGKAYRAPSINELYLNYPTLQGSPNLSPERIGTLDLSATYQTNRFQTSVTYFDSRHRDTIGGVFEPGLEIVRYGNSGAMHNSGVEFGINHYFSEKLFWSGTLVYLHAHTLSQARLLSLPTPDWISSGGISYQDKRSFTLSLLGVFRGPIPPPTPTPYQLPTSRQVNAHARFELTRVLGEAGRGYALFAHGVNLANQKVWFPGFDTDMWLPFRGGRVISYGLEVALSRD